MKTNDKQTGIDTIDPKMMARIQALRLMDDDFMSVVFDEDIELTEFFLRILLSRDDLKVKSVMSQKDKRNLFGRSVRLDIIAEDYNGKLYNVEVQRADKGASPKRVRFNLAMLDSHILQKSDDFDALPETYIIFITENDYYKQGKPVYKINKIINDNLNLTFDDGCNILYVNGAYRADDAIGHLMHDFRTADASEMYYNEIADRVRIHKQEEQGAKTM
ncbi:MAG: PD-(D/E)XK nuclease family transposase, partial [Spirochaetales bacterium]|nr:PD-(D/E)XK nuclease family transposase [Spirochaetales bacterium]